MSQKISRWWFAGEFVAVLFLFLIPIASWIEYTPSHSSETLTTDERRLAFQAVSEALKTGVTAISIAFALNGLILGVGERAKALRRDIVLGAAYGVGALVLGIWGLLALPQYVHSRLVTHEIFYGFIMAAHFTLLSCAFWRLFVCLVSVARQEGKIFITDPEPPAD